MLKLRFPYTVLLIALLCSPLLAVSPAWGDQAPAEVDTGPQSYSEQASSLLEEINDSMNRGKELEAELKEKQGLPAMILDSRILMVAHRTLDLSHQLCQLVIDREAAGEDPGPFRQSAQELLQLIPERVRAGVKQRLASADTGVDIAGLSVAELIALEDEGAELSEDLLEAYGILLRNLQLSEQLGIETSQQEEFLRNALSDAAERRSIGLEIARRYDRVIKRQSRALPDDAELAAKVKVGDEHIRRLNDDLRQLVGMMQSLDMRTVEYRQQLVAATGTVTTDILDFEVLGGILQRWLNTAAVWLKAHLPGIAFNTLLFLLIVWAAIGVSRLVRRLVEASLNRRPANISQLLQRMIISSAGNVVLILGLLFGLAQLGISVGPLLAGLGIAGFIIGFALQDTLGNFASGMLILFYRPYDVGDFIETNGVLGKVNHMSLVNTTILTIDNQTLVLPNSKIWGDVIKNVTAQRQRRVDMVFGIGYADDIAKAEDVLGDIVSSHEKVLHDPAPVVRLHTLNESSVDFVVRPWVMTEDYWDVYWDITRAVKIRFDESDISIPFPQRDIHLYSADQLPESRRRELDVEQDSVALAGTDPGED
jgi:small conductance mechanosensitive channel